MISEQRLEEVARALMADGLNATRIARRTGIPLVRVQRVMHRINGRDPAKANAKTLKGRQQRARQSPGPAAPAPSISSRSEEDHLAMPARQITRPDRKPALAYAARLGDHLGELKLQLEQWAARPDGDPGPAALRAAAEAVTETDSILDAACALRARIVAELRATRTAS